MVCTHCGAEVPAGSSFCSRCGQPVAISEAGTGNGGAGGIGSAGGAQAAAASPAPQVKRGIDPAAAVLVAAAVFAVFSALSVAFTLLLDAGTVFATLGLLDAGPSRLGAVLLVLIGVVLCAALLALAVLADRGALGRRAAASRAWRLAMLGVVIASALLVAGVLVGRAAAGGPSLVAAGTQAALSQVLGVYGAWAVSRLPLLVLALALAAAGLALRWRASAASDPTSGKVR